MRVVITGAGGQLGGDLVEALRRHGHEPVPLGRAECDITAEGSILDALRRYRPEVVVNCAAWTKVDLAETETDSAYAANAIGPRLLAAACDSAGVRLAHLSTDFVFDGGGVEPIDEWARPAPLSAYGASKLAGEREVARLCRNHQIVRTAWLYGRSGPNFVLTMLRLARERGHLRVVADQRGTPTWTGHLAAALTRLLETGIPGTYHLTNSGETTWHGFAQAIVAAGGLPEVQVEAIRTEDYPTAARRPRYSVLDNRAWRLLGEQPLPHWTEGLRAYIPEALRQQAVSAGPRDDAPGP